MTGRKFIIYWPGRQFQQIYWPGSHWGASRRGTWTGCNVYLVIPSPEIETRPTQNKVHYKFFHSVWIEEIHKPWKVTAAKNFSPVCMLWIKLASKNVFYSMWLLEDTIFYKSFRYFKIFHPPCCCFLWDKCSEKSLYFTFVCPQFSTITVQC